MEIKFYQPKKFQERPERSQFIFQIRRRISYLKAKRDFSNKKWKNHQILGKNSSGEELTNSKFSTK